MRDQLPHHMVATITSSATYDDIYEGNVIEVEQFNHGMHADTNIVTLANIEPDTEPVLLTDFLDVDDQVISVANTTAYATFNGISTSQGFIKINNEIIFYNSVGVNQLGIGTRGVDGSLVRTHSVNDVTRKYELNGFDLSRINNNHNLPNKAVSAMLEILILILLKLIEVVYQMVIVKLVSHKNKM